MASELTTNDAAARHRARSSREPADRIPTVTGETFSSLVLNGNGPIVVEFMSYGCAHCRALEPILQRVAAAVSANEQTFRVNVALDQDLATTYRVEGTPTLLMFLDSAEVGRVQGPHPSFESLLGAVSEPFR